MKTRMILLFVLAIALAVGGCARYGAKGNVPQDYKDDIFTVKAEKEGIRVTAFSVTRKADAKKFFDEDIVEQGGVLAFWVSIDNEGEYPVRFASANLKMGETVGPMDAYEVYKAVKKGPLGTAGRAYLWGIGAHIVGVYAIVGIIPAIVQSSTVNSDIERDIREKALVPAEIKPQGTAQGFLWFKIPGFKMSEKPSSEEREKITKALKEALLSIEVMKMGKSLEYNLSIF